MVEQYEQNCEVLTRRFFLLRNLLLGFIGVLGVMCLAGFARNVHTQPSLWPVHRFVALTKPRCIRPVTRPLCEIGTSEYGAVCDLLNHAPSIPIDGPVAVHQLRLWHHLGVGTAALVDRPAWKLLLGTGTANERAPLVITRMGARFRSADLDSAVIENHRDVFLATFGETGLPLTTSLKAETGSVPLSDVLTDSIANFNLKQREIEWSSVAYLLYLRAETRWHNKDGEVFSFDDLVSELMQRKLSGSSCSGSHLLMAMIVALRVDDQDQILQPATRATLEDRISKLVRQIEHHQLSDGSWGMQWHLEKASEGTGAPLDRLLPTGHLLECLTKLPLRLQPPHVVYSRAANWLIPQMQHLRKLPTFNSRMWFCPWTHSACALVSLCGGSGVNADVASAGHLKGVFPCYESASH